MRYLGIDYGSKRVGLALSDESGAMGFPHSIVANDADLAGTIVGLIKEKEVGAVVIGESRDLSGAANAVDAGAKRLGALIEKLLALPVYYESEVYTSIEARRQHEPSEKTRSPKQHHEVDASAAALILTSYLSRVHGQ